MVFYCFPRIIGRVHQEGKAIHQDAVERERERENERIGDGEGKKRMEGDM